MSALFFHLTDVSDLARIVFAVAETRLQQSSLRENVHRKEINEVADRVVTSPLSDSRGRSHGGSERWARVSPSARHSRRAAVSEALFALSQPAFCVRRGVFEAASRALIWWKGTSRPSLKNVRGLMFVEPRTERVPPETQTCSRCGSVRVSRCDGTFCDPGRSCLWK